MGQPINFSIFDVKLIKFNEFGDKMGYVTVVEECKDIPFDIKRVFYIYGVDASVVRGQHANRKSAFCLISIKGSFKVRVVDSAGETQVFVLDSPDKGLYLPSMIWKDMYDFSDDAVGLILSSEHYDSGEYIKNLDEFLQGDKS